MHWKERLYSYVKQRNAMALDYDISHIAPSVLDPLYLAAAERRLERVKALQLKRNATPIKHETKLKLIHAHESGEEATVVVALLQCSEYRLGRQLYHETKLEHEQLTIAPSQGSCVIRRIQPDTSERHTLSSQPLTIARQLMPLPYLNRKLLGNRAPAQAAVQYNRSAACSYADRWWETHNPEYEFFAQDDCTNFVSQCLFAGRAPMLYTGKRDSGWWYRGKNGNQELWSFSWAVADCLRRYLSANTLGWHANLVDQPNKLTAGDVISYDWDGSGRFGHSAFVTVIDANGMPLVNAHTTDSKHRYWDYRDSYAWTAQTQYRFYRMPDQF